MRQTIPGDLRALLDVPLRAEVQSWDGPDELHTVCEWGSYWDLAVDYWATWSDSGGQPPDHPGDTLVRDALDDAEPQAICLVAALIETAPSYSALAFAGAGYLEDLLHEPGLDGAALDWIAARVRQSARWRYAAMCVWIGDDVPDREPVLRAMGARRPADAPHPDEARPTVDFVPD